MIDLANLGLAWTGEALVSVDGRLRPLPTGSEAVPFADDAAGVVYKLFPLLASGSVGVKLAPKNGPDGWTVDSAPANLLETLEKISLLHDEGAIPSEIVGITTAGDVLVKQPLFTELSREQKANLLPLRAQAVALSQALRKARQLVRKTSRPLDAQRLRGRLLAFIESHPAARVDYIEFFEPTTLRSVRSVRRGTHLALAVFLGHTRLIDNGAL